MVKSRWWIVLVVSALVAAALTGSPGRAAAEEPAVVPNAGFEETATGGVIPGWTQAFGGGQPFSVVTEPVHGGSHSLRIDDPSADESTGLRSDPFAVTAGVRYRFGAQVEVRTGVPMIYAYFYDADGTELASASGLLNGVEDQWTAGSIEATAPEGTVTAAVMLYSSLAGITVAHVDDVTVAPAPGTVTDLGPQVHNVATNAAVYGTGADGRPVAYLALNGSPGLLVELDAETGALRTSTPLPGASGAWALARADDGTIYAGSFSNGHLYQWHPGQADARDLGRPLPDDTFLWDLAIGDDGSVYGGGYPSGAVFRYDPATGDVRDYGQLLEDSQYVRSLAWSRGKLYAGLGTQQAHLVELDPESGEVVEIPLPDNAAGATEVYDLDAARQRLFVRTSGPSVLLVWDTGNREWVADLGASAGVGVSPVGPGNEVYFIRDGELTSYNLSTDAVTPTGFDELWSARGFGWFRFEAPGQPGSTLVSVDYGGRIRHYNPRTGDGAVIDSEAPGQPATLHSVVRGPDRRIYTSGYQSGGLAAYDPTDGSSAQYPQGTVGQAEGMLTALDRLWLGIYPGAHILEFDPTEPFDYGTNPSEPFGLGELGQDRPFAMAESGGLLAVGTVPVYGRHGGVLSLYDPATGDVEHHTDLVPDHSIVSLAGTDDTVYGGTSVWGGLGSPPVDGDGVVFALDPGTGEIRWQVTPVPGERAITALAIGPDGTLWGASVGTLFQLDPDSGAVLRTIELYPYGYDPAKQVWRSAHLTFHADGVLYGNLLGHLLRIDTATGEATELTSGASGLALGDAGSVYFVRGTNLLMFEPQQ